MQATILYEQYPVNRQASTMWHDTDTVCGDFSNIHQYTMQVIMNNNQTFIALLPSTDLLINNNCSEVVAYTANLLPQGGPAKWSYKKPSIFAVHSPEPKFGSNSGSGSCPDLGSSSKSDSRSDSRSSFESDFGFNAGSDSRSGFDSNSGFSSIPHPHHLQMHLKNST